jgi:hypothetical protein
MLFFQFVIAAFIVLVVSATVDMEKVLKTHADKGISSTKLNLKSKLSAYSTTAPAAAALRGAQDSKVATFVHATNFNDEMCHDSAIDGGDNYIRLGSCMPVFREDGMTLDGHILYTHFKQGYFSVQWFDENDHKCERPSQQTYYIPQGECMYGSIHSPVYGEAWRDADGLVGTMFPSRESCRKNNLKVAIMFIPIGDMPYPSEFFGNAIRYSCNSFNSGEMSVYSFKRNGDVKNVQSMVHELQMCEDFGLGAFGSVVCLDSAANSLH